MVWSVRDRSDAVPQHEAHGFSASVSAYLSRLEALLRQMVARQNDTQGTLEELGAFDATRLSAIERKLVDHEKRLQVLEP